MPYQLAKELEEAGFKSTANTRVWERFHCPHEKKEKEIHIIAQCPEHIYFPTLSELIEACGKTFAFLSYNHDEKDWGAASWEVVGTENAKQVSEIGPTPDIAVARLWLALYAKPK